MRNRLYIGRKYGDGWPGLTLRFAGYLLKGLRHGMLPQTLRAAPAALRMTAQCTPQPLSQEAHAYLARTDAAHRGGWRQRLRREVLGALPQPDARVQT